MKILWLSPFGEVRAEGGPSARNAAFRRGFEQAGHEVLVWPSPRNAATRTRTVAPTLRSRVPAHLRHALRDIESAMREPKYLLDAARVFRAFRPDLIYERIADFRSIATIAGMLGTKYVAEFHAPVAERERNGAVAFNDAMAFRHTSISVAADRVVTVSDALRRSFVAQGMASDKVIVLPNGVDPSSFAANEHRRRDMRTKLGVTTDVVIGLVATMQPFHGLHLLPHLVSRVRSYVPGARCLVVGEFVNAEVRRRFHSAVVDTNTEAAFIMPGRVDHVDVPGWIDAMDVCLMPDSNDYGSPIKLFEYGAMRKACVFPKYAPIAEVVTDGQEVALFRPRDIDDMTRVVVDVITNSAKADALAGSLYDLVLRRHTWESNARTVLAAVGCCQAAVSHSAEAHSARP